MTVVRLSASNANLSGLEQAISGFGVDDVWNEGFVEGKWMQGVVLSSKLWDFVVILQSFNFHHQRPLLADQGDTMLLFLFFDIFPLTLK